jgi:hypothetical protein
MTTMINTFGFGRTDRPRPAPHGAERCDPDPGSPELIGRIDADHQYADAVAEHFPARFQQSPASEDIDRPCGERDDDQRKRGVERLEEEIAVKPPQGGGVHRETPSAFTRALIAFTQKLMVQLNAR